MISTDFAPLERPKDAQAAYAQLFHPWQWKKGKHIQRARTRMKKLFPKHEIAFFLTARAGLSKVLEALKVGEGSEVITIPFTCEAVIIPILANQATPVYVDIETDTFSLDAAKLENTITRQTKAIILQHTYGATPRDRALVVQIAKKYRIPVIEDLAHGFDLTALQTKPYTTIKLFSFGRSKAISSIWGGAVAIQQPQLIQAIKQIERQLDPPHLPFILRSLWYKPLAVTIRQTYNLGLAKLTIGRILHGATHMFGLIANELSARERKLKPDMHMTKAYPDAFAALLLVQLQTFEQVQTHRSRICSYYSSEFPTTATTQPLSRFPVLLDHRDAVYQHLSKRSIYLGRWYRKLMGDTTESCPVAHRICESIINLPTSCTMQEAELVVKALRQAEQQIEKKRVKEAKKKK